VTVTCVVGVTGLMATFVFRPVPEPLPALPTELEVYEVPLLSSFAGPAMTAGAAGAVTPCAFAGAGMLPIT
jgi:hypothetical protein